MPESSEVNQEQKVAAYQRLHAPNLATRPIPKDLTVPAHQQTPEQLFFDADGEPVEPWRNYKRTLPLVLGTVVDSSVKWRLAYRYNRAYAIPDTVQSYFFRQSIAESATNHSRRFLNV